MSKCWCFPLYSPHITEQLAVRLDHESPEEIRDKMQHSLNNLKFYAQRNKDFEVRCYWEPPNFKILRFDNTMFVSSFIGGGPKNDHSARMFQMVRDGNPLFAGFDRYFDDLWERAAFLGNGDGGKGYGRETCQRNCSDSGNAD